MQHNQPNHEVKLVFKEVLDEEEGVTFLNIYIEKPESGREITPDLMVKGEPTLAEQWGHELLGFIEDYLQRQLKNNNLQGYMLTVPKKKDMN